MLPTERAQSEAFHAAIVIPEGFDESRSLAGIGVLLRHVLSMQAAGAECVHLVGQAVEPPSDPRVTVRVEASEPPNVRTLVVSADVTMHRQLPARLTFLELQPRELRRLGTEAHVWLASAERVADVVAALVAGQAPDGPVEEQLLPDEFVLPVGTAAESRRAMWAHLDSQVKPTSGYFERLYMRRLSKRITRLLLGTPVTPNQMTFFTLGLSLLSAYLVSLPGATTLVAGGLLHIVMRIFDCVDGELARLKYQGSRLGAWLDSVGDGIGLAAFVAGVTIHVARIHPDWWLAGMYGVAAWCVVQGLQYYTAIVEGGGGFFHTIEWGHRAAHKTAIEAFVARVEMMLRVDAITTFYGVLTMLDLLRPLLVLHIVSATGAIFYFGNQVRKLARRRRA